MKLRRLFIAGLVLAAISPLSLQRMARADGPDAASQFGDNHFGVVLTGDAQQLVTLGMRWFLTYNSTAPANVPPGAVFVPFVPLLAGQPVPSDLASWVTTAPGSYWLFGNEPNVTKSDGELTGDQYAHLLHDANATIKQADPTAKIVGPNIINFDFTCTGCPGYPSGHSWMDDFLAAYQNDYDSLPPIDVWSIHTYPLDFENLPTVNASQMEDQLTEFRAYLDAIPGLAGAPIWDTEVGAHWGYEGLQWKDDGTGAVKAFPVGAFRTDLLLGYMQSLLGWMSTNSASLHLDHWFFLSTYIDAPEPWETVYAGINLMDGDNATAQLTPFGHLYRQLAGLSP